MAKPTILLDGLGFPEGPRWHQDRLWFSDMHTREVYTVDMQGVRQTIVSVPNRPSGLGFAPDGSLLVVSMIDHKLLRLEADRLSTVADLSSVCGGSANDMVVDPAGRAYIGNFGFDFTGGDEVKSTGLLLVNPDGQISRQGSGLLFPNGMVITPDGATLIVAETFGNRLTAFDIMDDGRLNRQRPWAQLPVAPDGICLDAEGMVWVANPRPPGGFLRVAPGGEVLDRIDSEDRNGYACMLGGSDGDVLFLLEAFESRPERMKDGQGRIRSVRVGVPRAGLP